MQKGKKEMNIPFYSIAISCISQYANKTQIPIRAGNMNHEVGQEEEKNFIPQRFISVFGVRIKDRLDWLSYGTRPLTMMSV